MPQKRWRRVDGARRSVFNFLPGLAALAVKKFLVFSARVGLIVLPTTLIGALAMVVLPATKGTAKITAARAARMSEEANPAVATAHSAVLPTGMIAQDSIQRELILTNKRKDLVVLMPDGHTLLTRPLLVGVRRCLAPATVVGFGANSDENCRRPARVLRVLGARGCSLRFLRRFSDRQGPGKPHRFGILATHCCGVLEP